MREMSLAMIVVLYQNPKVPQGQEISPFYHVSA